MKRTRLLATLVGLVAVTLLASPAFARNRMYNPATGAFMQRDPLGTPNESPLAREVSLPEFTRRDPAEPYSDGMNLIEYVGGNPTNNTDPTGLVYDIQVKRVGVSLFHSVPKTKKDKQKTKKKFGPMNVGHTWISWGDSSIGFWPIGDVDHGEQTGKVYENDDRTEGKPDTTWETELQQTYTSGYLWWVTSVSPTFQDGPTKGSPCCTATKDDIIACMRARGAIVETTKKWSLYGYNCRSFVDEVLEACCLKKK